MAALLGLFVMHGLAVHSAAHAGHGTDPMPAATAVVGHDHGAEPGARHATHRDAPPVTSSDGTPDRELLGLAGLCLAILVAGVALTLAVGRFVRLPRRRDPALARGWPARSRRHRDPPYLFALSIQRC